MKKGNIVYGVGLNDADYVVQVQSSQGSVDGKRVRKLEWYCPFYNRWKLMLQRCYYKGFHKRNSTYEGCYVSEGWLVFSNFKAWMEKQDWEGKDLDKDILFEGNKVYSKETCVFVDQEVNKFFLQRDNHRGEWPLGVDWDKRKRKYRARVGSKWLGYYNCPEEAHLAWGKWKYELAVQLAEKQSDERVAEALISRYSKYKGVK